MRPCLRRLFGKYVSAELDERFYFILTRRNTEQSDLQLLASLLFSGSPFIMCSLQRETPSDERPTLSVWQNGWSHNRGGVVTLFLSERYLVWQERVFVENKFTFHVVVIVTEKRCSCHSNRKEMESFKYIIASTSPTLSASSKSWIS